MTFSFHPEAESEFFAAIDYYEECELGLGQAFAAEANLAIQHVLEYPSAWPVLEGDVRRCLTGRFPYGILYAVEPDCVFVLAVMHLRREPGYWRSRRS